MKARLLHWYASSLKYPILLRLVVVALVASLLLLGLSHYTYLKYLERQRGRTSSGFNLLLRTTLENAMLKGDLSGLAQLVRQLGLEPGIAEAFVLNPEGRIRFSSNETVIDQPLDNFVAGQTSAKKPYFTSGVSGDSVLRSIALVENKPECAGCHGPVATHPINGIIVVDYDASEVLSETFRAAAIFSATGITVFVLGIWALWISLKKRVIEPITGLSRASLDIGNGQAGRRVQVTGHDEIATLGSRFNSMVTRIEEQFAALEAQRTYLQAVLNGLPSAVRVIRIEDMKVELVNDEYCRQLGITAADAIGSPCYVTSHRRNEPCIPTMVVCPVHTLADTGDTLRVSDRHVGDDGSVFPVDIHAARINIEQFGASRAYVVESITDMSQAVLISQDQRLSELGLLAAGIAHEIHNPLGSVKLGVQGLAREVEAGRNKDSTILEYLRLIDDEIDNCVKVTRRLILLSRAPSDSYQLFDIRESIADTVVLLGYDARARGIEQEVILPPTTISVLADEGELRMAFLNLIQNAHHAMPGGGRLVVEVILAERQVRIEIRDTGAGIAPQDLAQIFQPFYSRRADKERGTGLGLTIVKTIVERYGGSVEVASELGSGSTFIVCLPLSDTSRGVDT